MTLTPEFNKSDDYLLYGRGVARVFYEPVMVTVPDYDDSSGLDVEAIEGPQSRIEEETREAGETGNPGEVLDFEHVKIRFVQRHDFVHQPARTWDEVDWLAFRGYLDRDGLIQRFGEKIGKELPLSKTGGPSKPDEEPGQNEKAEIWEIWDRCKERVCWVSKDWPELLEARRLLRCPCPVYGTLTNDSFAPIPDYVFYQDQAIEIDRLTARIASLSSASILPARRARTRPK